MLIVIPSLGLHRKFHTIWCYDYSSYFRLCQVSYYIERLEVVAELVVLADRNSEEESVVLSAIECCRDRVYVHLLAQIEGLSGKRKFVYIYLRAESAVAYKALHCVCKASGHEVAV